MKIYSCKKQFFCGALDLPFKVGSQVYQYEQVKKLKLEGVHRPKVVTCNYHDNGWEVTDPTGVEWFCGKIIDIFFEFVKEVEETAPAGGIDLAITQYIVGADTWYKTIYEALDAAQKHGVDKPYIFLRPGEFELTETLVVSSPMIIEGSGDGTTIKIDFSTPAFFITSSGVEFRSFVLEGNNKPSNAFVFSGANGCKVNGCRLRNINGSTIVLQDLTRNTSIEGNIFQGFVNYVVDEVSGDFNVIANNVIAA